MNTIYKTVPKSVALTSERITKKSKEDVKDFVSKSLPNNRVAEIEALQHKYQVLDAVKEKWKRPSKKYVRNILSCQDKRKLKVFDIKKDGHKFENYIPLHRLWQDYMRDTTDIARLKGGGGLNKTKQILDKLLKADYHGCMIVVKKTKCPSLLGQAGIVLMETRNTFKIVTKEDKIKCIPKTNCVFAFELDGVVFTLYGNQFCVRTSERVKKSFKIKPTIDLS